MANYVVIGAGVIGVATAWQLCKAGHRVMLVDKHGGPCGGTSQRNGAQLSYSYCDALASPAILGRLPSILMGRDPAFGIRLQADPRFLSWGLRFLLNCSPGISSRNTDALLKMAAATELLLPNLLDEFPLAFDYSVPGKLVICRDAEAFSNAARQVAWKQAHGIKIERLDRAEAERVEPALAHYADEFAGVVWSPNDAVGNPYSFCKGLISGLEARYELRARYDADVTSLVKRDGKVVGVVFRNMETEMCDGVVLATGYDTRLMEGRKFDKIWPVQGYSLTTPASADAMRASITDPKRRVVFARLGDTVRIAGVADIGPRHFSFDQERYDRFKQAVASIFSRGFDLNDCVGWSEARPCTPSSRPIVGRSKLPGLYLNLGHGAFGWTLCLGSAQRVASVISDDRR